jgi:hypothetical protein
MPVAGRSQGSRDGRPHESKNGVVSGVNETGGRVSDVEPWAALERLSDIDPTRLTQSQRRLRALGGLRAEVNNGGFHQYFFNSTGDLVADAADAAETAGVSELASVIRRALDLLHVQDAADRAARQTALEDLDPEQFADIDDDYYAIEASIDLDAAMRRLMH